MIRSTTDAILIEVRVFPRSGRSGIAGMRADALIVQLHAPPVDGAANTELIEVIAEALGVPKRAVSIVAGERSKQKRVRVEGVSRTTAAAALARSAPDGPRGR